MELLEIERELAGPDRQEAVRRYDDRLVALEARRAAAVRAGLPPDEFRRCEALGEAVTLARKLIRLQAGTPHEG